MKKKGKRTNSEKVLKSPSLHQIIKTVTDKIFNNNYKEALAYVNELLKVDSDNVNILCLKGNILDLAEFANTITNKQNYSYSIYQKVLKLDPCNIAAIIDLADYFFYKKRPRTALKYYEKAIRLIHRKGLEKHKDEWELAVSGKSDVLICIGKIMDAFYFLKYNIKLYGISFFLKEYFENLNSLVKGDYSFNRFEIKKQRLISRDILRELIIQKRFKK